MRMTRRAAVAVALATTVPALAAGNALAANPTKFNYTGAEQAYSVAPGIHSLAATAIGGRGGTGRYQGGHGGLVTATLPVTPGQILYVNVGGNGGGGGGTPGGFNGGGASSAYSGGASG